jgi:hypothetical protein
VADPGDGGETVISGQSAVGSSKMDLSGSCWIEPEEPFMPEPKCKARIIERLEMERRRLEANLAQIAPEEMVKPGCVGEWSAKDVLAHLADWESRMVPWVEAARRGEAVETPEPGLTIKQLKIVNARIYARHRDRSLDDVLAYLRDTHRQFMEMVVAMPEEEMLARGRYPFTGTGCIWDWLAAYAAHDLWGKRHIQRWMKEGPHPPPPSPM